jgi:hypothetical protein
MVFLGQLHSSLNAAIDAALQARSSYLGSQLRSRPLGAGSLGSGQFGQQTGQHSGAADEFAEILTPGGRVISPSDAEGLAPLSGPQLRQAGHGSLTATTVAEGDAGQDPGT